MLFPFSFLTQLPAGWERGYCENTSKYFYFNSLTGTSTWSLQDVLALKVSDVTICSSPHVVIFRIHGISNVFCFCRWKQRGNQVPGGKWLEQRRGKLTIITKGQGRQLGIFKTH